MNKKDYDSHLQSKDESMKTFKEIHKEMFNEIYKSPEGWPDNFTMLDLSERVAKEYAYDMLDLYTKFLQEEGYIDTDATLEHPTAIDQFLKKDNPK